MPNGPEPEGFDFELIEDLPEVAYEPAGDDLDSSALKMCLGWRVVHGNWIRPDGKFGTTQGIKYEPSRKIEDAFWLADLLNRDGTILHLTVSGKQYLASFGCSAARAHADELSQMALTLPLAVTRAAIAYALVRQKIGKPIDVALLADDKKAALKAKEQQTRSANRAEKGK